MDLEGIFVRSVDYTWDALQVRWTRWLLLFICSLIFPLFLGYLMRIYRGENPAPEITGYKELFLDGIRYLAVYSVYLITFLVLVFAPLLISGGEGGPVGVPAVEMAPLAGFLALVVIGIPLLSFVLAPFTLAGAVGGGMWTPAVKIAVLAGFLIMVVAGIPLVLTWIPAIIRYARSGRIREAFNLPAVWAHIGRIGLAYYLVYLIFFSLALAFAYLAFTLPIFLFARIPACESILTFAWIAFSYIPISIFIARYTTLVYETAPDGL